MEYSHHHSELVKEHWDHDHHPNSRRSRNLLINPKFQIKFLLHLSLTALASVGVIALTQFAFGWGFLLSGLFGAGTFTYGALVLSAKIAGPLLKVHNHLAYLSAGETETIHFRKGDYFEEMIVEYNRLVDGLEKPEKLPPGVRPELRLIVNDKAA